MFWYVVLGVLVSLFGLHFWRWNWKSDPLQNVAYLEKIEQQLSQLPNVPQKYAVIGAGFCGLGVAAAFKRHGIAFDLLERDTTIGGNWYSGVYDTVHIISSRRTTEYKDFPMPSSYPDFPSKDQMLTYLRAYAAHWKLNEHLQVGVEVKLVKPTVDGDDGGKGWTVVLADGSQRYYGGVVVCNGHHWDRRWAGPYKAQAEFKGEVIHSKSYKGPSQLTDKRVLVIGGGNSACDIAAEAARFSLSSSVSHRRGYWFLPRTAFGKPLVECVPPWMPIWLQRIVIRAYLSITVGSYERYGLQRPDHNIWERHPTINSELLNYVKLGRITPYPDIDQFLGGHKVQFVDGRVAEFDMIVHATGYHVSLPLLAPGIVNWVYPRGKVPADPKTDQFGENGSPSVSPSGTRDGRQYPDLLQGLVPVRHRHIFVFGLGQPRYGAGPLITAAAQTLVALIKIQQSLKHPLGQVLRKVGAVPTTNYLQDPIASFSSTLAALRYIPRLPLVEAWLLPKHTKVE